MERNKMTLSRMLIIVLVVLLSNGIISAEPARSVSKKRKNA